MLSKIWVSTFVVLFISSIHLDAQCSVVSGETGTVEDSLKTISIEYKVTIEGTGAFRNLHPDTSCSLLFPDIVAPWSGNNGIPSDVTYTFSEPILSIKVFIAYTGIDGAVVSETFLFKTNADSNPILTINPGTCPKWEINSGKLVSPFTYNSVNALVTVRSNQPFTKLSILSGEESNQTGGSSYGLCSTSVVKRPELEVTLDDVPVTNSSTTFFDETGPIEIKQVQVNKQYWIHDPSGKEIRVLVNEITIDGKNVLIKLAKL